MRKEIHKYIEEVEFIMTEQEKILQETIRILTKWNNGEVMRESELQLLQHYLLNVSIEVTTAIRELHLDRKNRL